MSAEDESLNDLASETLRIFSEAVNAAAPFNDFGSVLGARDEIELIERDLREALCTARLRAGRLKVRIGKWDRGEREVGKLKDRAG